MYKDLHSYGETDLFNDGKSMLFIQNLIICMHLLYSFQITNLLLFGSGIENSITNIYVTTFRKTGAVMKTNLNSIFGIFSSVCMCKGSCSWS